MSKTQEALKLSLEALDDARQGGIGKGLIRNAITAIREALAEQKLSEPCRCGKQTNAWCMANTCSKAEQPAQQQEPVAVCDKCHGLGYYDEGHECDDGSMVGGNYVECDKCKHPEFIKHEVEHPYDWSEWVCPNPKSYLMKCCDCGLVHEAQFGVVRYKSETEREDCDMVNDSNLQAVFRMRRSEQWSPEDTAYRPGGLPMAEQPAQQQEPVEYVRKMIDALYENGDPVSVEAAELLERMTRQQQEPAAWVETREDGSIYYGVETDTVISDDPSWLERPAPVYFGSPANKPWIGLTQRDIDIAFDDTQEGGGFNEFARAIEAKLREKNA